MKLGNSPITSVETFLGSLPIFQPHYHIFHLQSPGGRYSTLRQHYLVSFLAQTFSSDSLVLKLYREYNTRAKPEERTNDAIDDITSYFWSNCHENVIQIH